MATREIKTTIALDGEQQFKKALADASREMRVMESEAKSLSAAYDANGDAASYFASRQQNLRNQIKQQEEIVSALEKAVKDSAETFGESSAQTDGWAIKLNNARTRLSKLQKQLDSADREVEELGRDSVKAGRQLEQGVGEGAEAAEKDVRSLIETMQDDLSSIKTSSAFSAVGSLWNMASGAFDAVSGFTDGTKELRLQMSFLEQNAKTEGFDFSDIIEQMQKVTTVTNDTSSAIEGLSNLMAVEGMDTDQMARSVELLAGAVISFPETMKFESLADSLQETIATGEATGQYSELLSRMGVDIEAFNKALEESETTSGDLDIALAYLSEHGLQNVYDQWDANNRAMNEASETQFQLEQEFAEFGGTLEQYIVTPVKKLLVGALGWVNDTVEDWTETTVSERLAQEVEELGLESEAQRALEVWSGLVEGTKEMLMEDQYLNKTRAETAIGGLSIIRGEKEDSRPALQAAGQEAAQSFMNGMEMELDASLWNPELATPEAVLIKPVESAMQGWFETVREAAESLQEARDDFEREGEESSGAFADAFENRAQELISRTSILGRNAGTGFGAGLRSTVSYVNSAAAAVAAAARAGLSTAASGARNVILQVDGRELARTTATYYDAALSVAE